MKETVDALSAGITIFVDNLKTNNMEIAAVHKNARFSKA